MPAKKILLFAIAVGLVIGAVIITRPKKEPAEEYASAFGRLLGTSQHRQISNSSASELIDSLSLEEKVAQHLIISLPDTELDSQTKRLLETTGIGGIILFERNINSPAQLKKLIADIQLASLTHPRPWIAIDQEGGSVSRLPWLGDSLGQGEIATFQQAYDAALWRGKQLKELGITLNFTPVIEPIQDSNSYLARTNRAFPGKPTEVENLALASIKGYQQAGTLAVPKHIPLGLGETSQDPHHNLPRITSSSQQVITQLKGFDTLLEITPAIMVTHLSYPEIDTQPTSLSSEFIQNMLRNDLGFEGIIVSDDLAMKAITNNYSILEATKQAITAGSHLVIISQGSQVISPLINQLSRQIPEALLDQSLSKSLEVKQDYLSF